MATIAKQINSHDLSEPKMVDYYSRPQLDVFDCVHDDSDIDDGGGYLAPLRELQKALENVLLREQKLKEELSMMKMKLAAAHDNADAKKHQEAAGLILEENDELHNEIEELKEWKRNAEQNYIAEEDVNDWIERHGDQRVMDTCDIKDMEDEIEELKEEIDELKEQGKKDLEKAYLETQFHTWREEQIDRRGSPDPDAECAYLNLYSNNQQLIKEIFDEIYSDHTERNLSYNVETQKYDEMESDDEE